MSTFRPQPVSSTPPSVTGDYVTLDDERYLRITNSHLMPAFMMSLVGASDHWMFVSSNGALTAGRRNADNALFPYATDDQLSAARGTTGSTTLMRMTSGERSDCVWEAFALYDAEAFEIRRNLYKTPLGNKLIFEEINDTLGLSFRYRWTFSERFGFVRSCWLENIGDGPCSLELLDGLRNVLPYGVASEFMMRFSNLANAYKKSELLEESGLGLFLLSSIPTDRAEPSECLKATTIWQTGLTPDTILLSDNQIGRFRTGESPETEGDVRGQAGAFLLCDSIDLAPSQTVAWHIVAELAQDHSDVAALHQWLTSESEPDSEVAADILASERNFLQIVSSSDGLQHTSNARRTDRHLSNTVFNLMRGGVPVENYVVRADDFRRHIAAFHLPLRERHTSFFENLPTTQTVSGLHAGVDETDDPDLRRLAREYLPLAFSRRHGDPTRPWNRFSIDLRSEDGRTSLNYEGNWRDIFQNWEALAVSFPEFSAAMLCRFVNATTADGYNPYRVTKDGFDWEEPTPDDPWANIGYWGDHQIIYLLKLLEWNRRTDPGGLDTLLTTREFVHANIPYRIKPFEDIKRDPQSTIDFDADLSQQIARRVAEIGSDGKLLRDQADEIHRVTLLEKLLTLSLAKLSNFVPDGGVWLNTQRPEWNDANNALVGNGLSMVTTCYLHRWFRFLQDWLEDNTTDSFVVSREVAEFFRTIAGILDKHATSLGTQTTPGVRASVVESLSQAGSDYRRGLYKSSVSGQLTALSRDECVHLLDCARKHLAATIRNNERPDGLYHAYNLLDWGVDGIAIEHLDEMLEGQVAVLSSGLLSPTEAVQLLDALRSSALYRENQNSYMLYPDRQLPRFADRNTISANQARSNPLLQRLLDDNNEQIMRRDINGDAHFNGKFRNSADLRTALAELPAEYESLIHQHRQSVCDLFEETFGHRRFTGRSGTFFAYEGLGSIYWHMVSKLALAASENFFRAIAAGESSEITGALRVHFRDICAGIGAEKTPTAYGAFPTDPYSHTPEHAGVKQPGMTGQVKEDILSRFAELGVHVTEGGLQFRIDLLDRDELLRDPSAFHYFDLSGDLQSLTLPPGSLAFTLCQVPVTYGPGDADTITVHFRDGEQRTFSGSEIDSTITSQLFARSGEITKIECVFESL